MARYIVAAFSTRSRLSVKVTGMTREPYQLESENRPIYLFYSADHSPSGGEIDLPGEYEWTVWKPTLKEISPKGIRQLRKRFALRWLMHHLHLFSNGDYQVLIVRHSPTGDLVHYSGATGRYWRWPFMRLDDMQIGDGVCQLVEKHLASRHGAERS